MKLTVQTRKTHSLFTYFFSILEHCQLKFQRIILKIWKINVPFFKNWVLLNSIELSWVGYWRHRSKINRSNWRCSNAAWSSSYSSQELQQWQWTQSFGGHAKTSFVWDSGTTSSQLLRIKLCCLVTTFGKWFFKVFFSLVYLFHIRGVPILPSNCIGKYVIRGKYWT